MIELESICKRIRDCNINFKSESNFNINFVLQLFDPFGGFPETLFTLFFKSKYSEFHWKVKTLDTDTVTTH